MGYPTDHRLPITDYRLPTTLPLQAHHILKLRSLPPAYLHFVTTAQLHHQAAIEPGFDAFHPTQVYNVFAACPEEGALVELFVQCVQRLVYHRAIVVEIHLDVIAV